jgi:predicted RNA-binding protein
VQSRCEALGFTLSVADVDEVYHAVIALTERRKAISDGELRRIVEQRNMASGASGSSGVGYGHGV